MASDITASRAEIGITLSEFSNGTSNFYDFRAERGFGRLLAKLDRETRLYYISDVDVNVPRRGIGKALMRRSQEHAQMLGARVIAASIISRECLESMEDVFGSEHVAVTCRGDYVGEGDRDTSAALYKRLAPED